MGTSSNLPTLRIQVMVPALNPLEVVAWMAQCTRQLREINNLVTLTQAWVQQPTQARARCRGGRGWGRREQGRRVSLGSMDTDHQRPRWDLALELFLVLLPSLAWVVRRAVCAYAGDPCTLCFWQGTSGAVFGGVWANRRGPGVPPEFPRYLTLHTSAFCSPGFLMGFFL